MPSEKEILEAKHLIEKLDDILKNNNVEDAFHKIKEIADKSPDSMVGWRKDIQIGLNYYFYGEANRDHAQCIQDIRNSVDNWLDQLKEWGYGS